MKRLLALSVLAPTLLFAAPAPSHAGSSTDAALALGSFAVFNQLIRGETVLHDLFGRGRVVRETVVVEPPPPVVYAPPPQVIYAPPPPPRVVYMASPPVVVHQAPSVVYVPVKQKFIPPGHMKKFKNGHGRGHWKHDD